MRILATFLLLAGSLWAQADTFPTSLGEMKITPIRHGSVMLEVSGKVWHIDPWSQADYSSLPKADVILITDIHGDHLDPKAIAQVKKDSTVIVAPAAVAKTVTEAKVLNNGESTTIGGIKIETVPMYNLKRGPEAGKLFHDKGRGNGYILNVGDTRVYFSGDTEVTDEMKALEDIDVAFVCMNLPYTMTPGEAATCVNDFKPKIVYPYHYGKSNLQEFTSAVHDGVEVRLRKWY